MVAPGEPGPADTNTLDKAFHFLLHSHNLARFLDLPDLARLALCNRACRACWGRVRYLHASRAAFVSNAGFHRACHQEKLGLVVSLSVRSTGLDDTLLKRLGDALPYLPALQALDLSHNPGIKDHLPHLIRGRFLLPTDATWPTQCVLGRLRWLSLAATGLDDLGLVCLALDVLPYLPALEELDLGHNPALTFQGVELLANAPVSFPPKLRVLRLSHNDPKLLGRHTEEGEALINMLLQQNEAFNMFVENELVALPHAAMDAFVMLLGRLAPSLEGLDLTRTGITAASLQMLLDKGVHLGSCRMLWLGQNILQKRGAKVLTTALLLHDGCSSETNELEVLNLNDCYMSDEGVSYFAQHALASGRLANLRELRLQNNGCGAAAAGLLGTACVHHLPRLEVLGLRMNTLTNDGAIALGKSLEGGCLPALRVLSLAHNFIEQEGAEFLLTSLLAPGRCPVLRWVDLSHNGLPVKAAAELDGWVQWMRTKAEAKLGGRLGKVDVILGPPALYCQLLLEEEEEEEEEEDEKEEEVSLFEWTVGGVFEMVHYASTFVK